MTKEQEGDGLSRLLELTLENLHCIGNVGNAKVGVEDCKHSG